MISKVQPYHTQQTAYVYLRQSTPSQVLHHQQSTERQYALRSKALELGWLAQKIRILDGDLGVSGTRMDNRGDFKTLVADVSMNKVGAVFALEASRLSRSSTDWHRLLELCSLTDTLIIDEDGCYDPTDFNDQLLLGLKGTMSQAELHFIRARLQGGKLHKAEKGQLRIPLPVGLCYDEEAAVVLDPDQEVRSAVQRVFELFRQTGSAHGVVESFGRLKLRFPKRAHGGVWDGKLSWGRLTYSRAREMVKNPSYAGAYVYGRFKSKKRMSTEGTVCSIIVRQPISRWQVLIKDHHEGYISWEEYLENQRILARNQTNGEGTVLSGPAREGIALLQGLLLCGKCGHRMTIRYRGNGGIYPIYQCNWSKREGLSATSCLSFRCDLADEPVAKRILEVLQPDQMRIAVQACEELERRDEAVDNQWQMRIQRADYEAQLAQRRYEEVDPSNRLVAATLERRWNDALVNLEQTREECEASRRKHKLILGAEQKSKILQLAEDLPRLWNAPSTKHKDRKRIARLLLKDITVEKDSESRILTLHIRWHGGVLEDMEIALPPKAADKLRYAPETIETIRRLAHSMLDAQIADALNEKGQRSATNKPFTALMIRAIRYKYRIPRARLKEEEELTVGQIAGRFDVSSWVVHNWIRRGYLKARRVTPSSPYWITLDVATEAELRRRASRSRKPSTAAEERSGKRNL